MGARAPSRGAVRRGVQGALSRAERRRPAADVALRGAVVALALAWGACRGAPDPAAGTRVLDLLPLLPHAQLVSDVVDLPLLVVRPHVRHDGFSLDARGVLRARSNAALVRFRLEAPAPRDLALRCRLLPEHGSSLPLRVTLNGQRCGGRLSLTTAEQELRFPLPVEAQRSGPNELRFATPQGGRRRPALEILGLTIRSSAADAAARAPASRDGGFWLPKGARVSLPLVAPADATALRLRARGGPGSARLVVGLRAEGAPEEVAETLDVSSGAAAAWKRALRPAATVWVLELASEGAGVELRELAIERRPPRWSSLAVPSTQSPDGRPDVVLYVVDTLRADELGAYGQPAPTSPHLDAFAANAALFEDATAQSSWTRPSVATLLTGLDAESHGVGDLTQLVSSQAPRLAEGFQAAGYRTAAFNANGVIGERGYGQGFGSWSRLGLRPARELVEAAVRFVRASPEPAFVYVHVLEPHRPYAADAPYWEPFARFTPAALRRANELPLAKQVTPADRELLLAAYRAEVRQADAAFGALLEGLRGRTRGGTVVAATADHGDELFDRGAHGHGYSLYQEVLRVPLAIGAPGARASRVRTPVQHADVPPTLLALAGLRPDARMQGRDLSQLVRGGEPPETTLLVSRLRYRDADKLAARRGGFKLIVNLESGDPDAALELYDLASDPSESRNLAGSRPTLARALLAEASLHGAEAAARRAALGAVESAGLSEEQQDELRALGYVE